MDGNRERTVYIRLEDSRKRAYSLGGPFVSDFSAYPSQEMLVQCANARHPSQKDFMTGMLPNYLQTELLDPNETRFSLRKNTEYRKTI